ncbi:hypothetical protein EDD11_003809 [Mortierella claussenii]|nr:hypothetical protein EDD11_003809 [Mortierella claussenii]
MTVSTSVAHDDTASDAAKHHACRDQDFDIDHSLSKTHERPCHASVDDEEHGCNDEDSTDAHRSNSINESARPSRYHGHSWDQENRQERPGMYTRSARSAIENYEGHFQHEQEMQGQSRDDKGSPPGSDSQPGDEGEIRDELMSEDDNLEDDESEENEDGSGSRDGGTSAKNEDGSDAATSSTTGERKPVKVRSMFVDKLFRMVEDPTIQHLISWAKEGDMFYVYNCIKLSDAILPKFFKHNNWQSFVRQLNMYGFHKKESNLNRKNPETQRWQFYHPHFQRDFPHLRKNIKRKSARSMNTAPATSRVVFEHGKGYFLQRNDRSRSNSGEGSHTSTQGHHHNKPVLPAPHLQQQHHPPRHPSLAQSPRDLPHRDTMMTDLMYIRRDHPA